MIKFYENQTVIEFGTGDICVNGGDTLQGDIGIVAFANQDEREIGSHGKILAHMEYKHDDVDVLIKFTKIESIDVVIDALENAKACMIK